MLHFRNGNLNQWWNNKTTNQFKLRTACIRDQYSNYTLEGSKLNGKQSLGIYIFTHTFDILGGNTVLK